MKFRGKFGDVYTLLCLRPAERSKAFGLRKLCYSTISVMMLLGYMVAGMSQKKMPCVRLNGTYFNI